MRIINQQYWGFWEVVDESAGILVSKGRFNTQEQAQAYIDRQQDLDDEYSLLINEMEHNK